MGVGCLTDISVQIGEYKVPAAAINSVPNHPGLYQIVLFMPNIVVQKKDNLALSAPGCAPQGSISTDTASIALEGSPW
jgi:hypothetical protein